MCSVSSPRLRAAASVGLAHFTRHTVRNTPLPPLPPVVIRYSAKACLPFWAVKPPSERTMHWWRMDLASRIQRPGEATEGNVSGPGSTSMGISPSLEQALARDCRGAPLPLPPTSANLRSYWCLPVNLSHHLKACWPSWVLIAGTQVSLRKMGRRGQEGMQLTELLSYWCGQRTSPCAEQCRRSQRRLVGLGFLVTGMERGSRDKGGMGWPCRRRMPRAPSGPSRDFAASQFYEARLEAEARPGPFGTSEATPLVKRTKKKTPLLETSQS